MAASHVTENVLYQKKINGAFFWGYSDYSYSDLGIREHTEFQFRKECSYMFQIWKRNRGGPENYSICART